MAEHIKTTRLDKVLRMTMDRPPANAYNMDFHRQLNTVLRQVEDNREINVVLLDSCSEKFFCAGADIKDFQNNSEAGNRSMVDLARENVALMESSSKIFIAAIAGHCLGGGLELALACDLRIAADREFLVGLPEIKLGLMPGNGGSQRLAKLVGQQHALKLLLTGDPISPRKAVEIGLFNETVAEDEFPKYTLSLSTHIAKGPALALAAIKKAVRTGAGQALPEALKTEAALVDTLYETEDAREGFQAFLEKRNPDFKGK